MSGLHVETLQHEIEGIGFTEDRHVVITFDNGPVNGEVSLAPETLQNLYDQWKAFCVAQEQSRE